MDTFLHNSDAFKPPTLQLLIKKTLKSEIPADENPLQNAVFCKGTRNFCHEFVLHIWDFS